VGNRDVTRQTRDARGGGGGVNTKKKTRRGKNLGATSDVFDAIDRKPPENASASALPDFELSRSALRGAA